MGRLGSVLLLYSDSCLHGHIKYETCLTSLSCLFSSFFLSVALRFSSSSSLCLCSSAAFISAWKVSFLVKKRTIATPTEQCWGTRKQLLHLLPVFRLPSFSWAPRFLSSVLHVDVHGPPWLQREVEGWFGDEAFLWVSGVHTVPECVCMIHILNRQWGLPTNFPHIDVSDVTQWLY